MAASLEIMKLVSYKDSSFTQTINEYTALVSPESYSISYGIEINDVSAPGSSVPVNQFNKGAAQTISFKILFDGTGIIKKNGIPGLAILGNPGAPNVTQEIDDFKKVVYNYQGEIHSPSFVQIRWGKLLYNCNLAGLIINFKLFKPDGTPLRAEAYCTFRGAIDEKKRAAIEDRQSPDITRIRTVKEGDTLSLLCFREYGDSRYYYQVAKINRLTDFKQLSAGMKLKFPAIAK